MSYNNRQEWRDVPRLMVFNQTLGQIKQQQDHLKQMSDLDYSKHCTALSDIYIPTQVTQVSLKSLINSISTSNTRILIKGPHGIGKSLLLSRICQYWAKNFGLRKFKLLLLINLATIHSSAVTLDGLLQQVLPAKFGQLISRWIVSRGGENVLFILDGWSQKEETYDIYLKLVLNRLKKCTVIVASTSKPSVLRSRDCTQFDMLGLTPVQISQQATKFYKTDPFKAEEFLRYIANCPDIKHMTPIPVYLYGLLFLFDCVPVPELPVTLTELFSCMTLLFMVPSDQTATHLPLYMSNFPRTLPTTLKAFLHRLSRIAYTGMDRGETVPSGLLPQLTYHQHIGFVLLRTECPSLMQKEDAPLRFTFPLLRDFLAAIHVHTLPLSEQTQLMEKRRDQVSLWKFYSGLIPAEKSHEYFSTLQNAGCVNSTITFANYSHEAGLPVKIHINIKDSILSGADIHHLLVLSLKANIPEMKFQRCTLGSEALIQLSKLKLYLHQPMTLDDTVAQSLFLQ